MNQHKFFSGESVGTLLDILVQLCKFGFGFTGKSCAATSTHNTTSSPAAQRQGLWNAGIPETEAEPMFSTSQKANSSRTLSKLYSQIIIFSVF